MTTSVTTAHAGAPTSPALTRPRPVNGRLTFAGVLRSEWIKLLSLRSIRWSVLVMLLLSWGGAFLLTMAMNSTDLPAEAMPSLLVQAATFGSLFTVLIMGVIGVLSITSEYASGLILSSLTAVPKRTPVLAAKAVAVATLGLVVGGLSTFGGALIAAIFFTDGFALLGEGDVLASLVGATLFLALAALIALGIGAMVRSSAGAISIVAVLMFVATLVFQVLTITGWDWVPIVAQWMPADLGQALSNVLFLPEEARGDVTYWAALGGLIAWAAAMLVPAAILLKKRDAV